MIKLNKINKFFNKGKPNEIHVINNTSIEFPESGLVALLGKSGSGKTTLLNVLGGLDNFNSGNIQINDIVINKYNSRVIDSIRSKNIGYIFQNYYLIDDQSVYDNLDLSLRLAGFTDKEEKEKRIDYALSLVGLSKFKKRNPNTLSGGQQQRVGIARALVKGPSIIIADEPTGNLDSDNTFEIMDILKSISKHCLVVLVTHEEQIAKFFADRIIRISDGQIIDDIKNENDDDLAYADNKKIFLKDLKYSKESKADNISINYKGDKKSNIALNLVLKDGRLYIDSSACKMPISLIDEKSEIKLIDAHYEDKKKKIHQSKDIDLSLLKHKHFKIKKNVISLLSVIKKSWRNYFNTPLKKKLPSHLLLFSLSMIIAIVFCLATSILFYDEDLYYENKNLITMQINETEMIDDILKDDNNYLVIKGNIYFKKLFNSSIKSDSYFYDNNELNHILDIYIYGESQIEDIDVIYGTSELKNDNEVLIDIKSAEKSLEKGKPSGIMDYEFFIGENIRTNYGDDLTIVGIIDSGFTSAYVKDDIYDSYVTKLKNEDELNNISFIANNKENIKEYAQSKGLMIEDDFERELEDFETARRVFKIMITVVISISILLMFAISSHNIKANFINRIKEIGTYRCIGVSKGELIKEFVIDNIYILSFSALLGVILAGNIMSKADFIKSNITTFTANPLIFICTAIFIYLIYECLVVLKVLSLLRLTPANIMAKYDI